MSKYLLKAREFTISPTNESDIWESKWNIVHKESEKIIGWVSFEGHKEAGTIPFSIWLEEGYRDRDYGKQAIRMMVDFAFLHSNIYEVKTECEHENDAYIVALEKSGFVYRDKDSNAETYSIIKQKTSWLGLYIILGVAAGLVLGILLNVLWAGLIVGLIFGLIIGAVLDSKEKAQRKKVTRK